MKARPSDLWVTGNIRRVTVTGIEAGVRRVRPGGTYVGIDYAFNRVDPADLALIPKYTLDYAPHSFVGSAGAALPRGLSVGARVDARARTGRDPYVLVDLRLSRPVGAARLFVDGTNLLNTRDQEVRGVVMPGRWITAGVQWNAR